MKISDTPQLTWPGKTNLATQQFTSVPSGSVAAMRMASNPKFGGIFDGSIHMLGRTLSPTLPVFELIASTLIYSMLAEDVIGLWTPRIGVSLDRGRKKYDYQNDPERLQLSPPQQFKRWLYGTIKGLNWANAAEESLREFCSGPGFMIVPSLGFAWLYQRGWPFNKLHDSLDFEARKAMGLGHERLGQLASTFQKQLQTAELTPATTDAKAFQEAYRQQYKTFLENLLHFEAPTAARGNIPAGVTHILDMPLSLHVKESTEHFRPRNTTLRTLMGEWAEEMSKEMLKPRSEPKVADLFTKLPKTFLWDPWAKLARWAMTKVGLRQPVRVDSPLENAQARVAEAIRTINRQVYPYERVYDVNQVVLNLFRANEHRQWEVLLKDGNPVSVSIETLFKEMHRFNDFAYALQEKVLKKNFLQKLTSKTPLVEAVEHLVKKVQTQKAFGSIGLLSATCAYLWWLMSFVQHNKIYPANSQYLQQKGTSPPSIEAGKSPSSIPPTQPSFRMSVSLPTTAPAFSANPHDSFSMTTSPTSVFPKAFKQGGILA